MKKLEPARKPKLGPQPESELKQRMVSCRHTEDLATREALKALWLAGTDAIREPRYAALLEQAFSAVSGLTVCGPGCALELILDGQLPQSQSPKPAVELLMRIMDNDECPEELLRWTLGVAGVEDVQVRKNLQICSARLSAFGWLIIVPVPF